MKQFLWKYLVGPIVADAQNVEKLAWNGVTAFPGYNPVNTVTYAVSALILLYGAYIFFQRKNVEFNSATAVHSIPFIFLGGSLRFLEDASAIPYPYNIALITPFVYFLVAALYIPTVTYLNEKKTALTGALILTPVLVFALLNFQAVNLYFILGTALISSVLVVVYYQLFNGVYVSTAFVLMAFTQFFEGSASMLSTFYGYSPKQLLGQFFYSLMGFPGILVMKFLVLALAVNVVKDVEGEELRGLALLAVYSIGLGTGFRVFLRVAAGI